MGCPDAVRDVEEPARRLVDPVASLVGIPFQGQVDGGFGRDGEGTRRVTNIRPVIPVALGAERTRIPRTILPASRQEHIRPGPGPGPASGSRPRARARRPRSRGPAG